MDTKDSIRLVLIDLMDSTKTSGKELAEAIGVTPQAVSAWRKGRSSIDVDNIPAICEFFGISVSTFFEKSNPNTGQINGLTADEQELINIYRTLTDKGKHAVLAGLKDYASSK